MVSELIKQEFKCNKVTLGTGMKVSASSFTVKEGKISQLNGNLYTSNDSSEPYMNGSFSAS